MTYNHEPTKVKKIIDIMLYVLVVSFIVLSLKEDIFPPKTTISTPTKLILTKREQKIYDDCMNITTDLIQLQKSAQIPSQQTSYTKEQIEEMCYSQITLARSMGMTTK